MAMSTTSSSENVTISVNFVRRRHFAGPCFLDYVLTGEVQLRDLMLKPMDLTSAGFRGGGWQVVASFQWTGERKKEQERNEMR
jgi:hypothetical protein